MKKFINSDSAEEFLYSKAFEDYYNDNDFSKAFDIFTDFLENDSDLFRAYRDNISICMQDAFLNYVAVKKCDDEEIDYNEMIRKASNRGAEDFLKLLLNHKKISKNIHE